MLLIRILFYRWHIISPEGYREEFTKIDKHHLCQLNNVILNNLSGIDLVRRSQSYVKGHRRGGVCVLRMLLVYVAIVNGFNNRLLGNSFTLYLFQYLGPSVTVDPPVVKTTASIETCVDNIGRGLDCLGMPSICSETISQTVCRKTCGHCRKLL